MSGRPPAMKIGCVSLNKVLTLMSLASYFMKAGRRPDGPLCVNVYLYLKMFTGFATEVLGLCPGRLVLQKGWSFVLSCALEEINRAACYSRTVSERLWKNTRIRQLFKYAASTA